VKTEWKVNDHFSAEKNPDYWQDGEDGKPLPYLDEIEFRPQGEQTQRIEGVATGTYDAAHIENGDAISQAETIVDEGLANLITTFDFAEVAYLLLNESKAPFDNLDARLAVASALDREALNQTLNQGKTEVASGPFAPGSMGYVEDTPMPPFDLSAAKKLVAAYEQATGQKRLNRRFADQAHGIWITWSKWGASSARRPFMACWAPRSTAGSRSRGWPPVSPCPACGSIPSGRPKPERFAPCATRFRVYSAPCGSRHTASALGGPIE
jgi:hypothetical protein